jgi:hypothetical protein
VEAVPLRPAEVHPEEHLGPVGRLGPAGAGADRQERPALVVLAREEQLRPLPGEVGLEALAVALELRGQLLVAGFLEQLDGSEQVVGTRQEIAPGVDLGAQTGSFAEDLLGGALVVPEPGREGQRVELVDAALLRGEVKDAPRSTGSAPPGRGRQQRPLVLDLEVLEQDRAKLDQPEGGLASGDDGVHAGTVSVMWADSAVAVTVEGRRIAARSAVPLAGDEIDERCFLGLLH